MPIPADWPAPAPGTHESDQGEFRLRRHHLMRGSITEYDIAAKWSQSNQ